ncbi:MAG: hypothetical protein AB7F22_23450 [Reyranella sp.]|uniref:hypothetical protein n=1 Tax=Reyranella sp. TaxID=1929291 RepID=UPI003D11E010
MTTDKRSNHIARQGGKVAPKLVRQTNHAALTLDGYCLRRKPELGGGQMNGHGWFSVAESASAVSGKAKCNFETVFPHYTGDQLIGSGFRNFLCKPGPNEIFRFKGQPIDRKNQGELRTAIAKLSWALEYQVDGDRSVGENPGIPSGYGYLMQLIAHDLVASSSSLGRIDSGRMALNNNRSAKLRLESIYGGGPEGSPLLYEPSRTGDSTTPRAPLTHLRLGPLNTNKEFSCPFRDLARDNLTKSVDDINAAVNTSAASAALPGLPDVIVGDPRNDDHAIISQLTVVFHLLHNGLVEKTKGMPTHSRYTEAGFNRYFYARMAATLIFRNVIRHDVLKRFLHPEVYSLYNVEDPPFLDAFEDAVPLELTHGALRVCHSMLRANYKLNERADFQLSDILSENSVNNAPNMPLPEIWAAAWSHFFEFEGQAAPHNMSVLLGPHYNTQVATPAIFPPIDDVTVHGEAKWGLAYRDMLSAALAGLWSAPALIERLSKDPSPLAKLFSEWPLARRADRESVLRNWLSNRGVELTETELDTLTKDPPLPFFLMFEALEDGKGARFGLLGSIIVAEAIFGVLNQDPVVPCHPLAPLDKALEALGRDVFDEPGVPAYPRLDTMSDVITFVADMHGLQNARPKFI